MAANLKARPVRQFSRSKRAQIYVWQVNLPTYRAQYRLYQSIRDLVQKMHGATAAFHAQFGDDYDLYYLSNADVVSTVLNFIYSLPPLVRARTQK